MKQAIIILAHNDISLLIHLVEYFRHDCDVFIHIDKKADVNVNDMKILKSLPQVKAIYRKYAVRWGGFSILKAQTFMLGEAYKMSNASTFHVISGHDYPIKPLDRFLKFFSDNNGFNYIAFRRVGVVGTDFDSYYRYQYFFPYDYSDNRESLPRKTSKWVTLQRELGVNRGIPTQFDRIYCGSQWFSITRCTVWTILEYTDRHPSFYKRLRFTFAPEETYFLTVILNLCNPKSIINKNYRFIRWHNENGNSPANLAKEHFHLLAETEDFFARKVCYPYAKSLVPLIDKYLLIEQEITPMACGGWKTQSMNSYPYDEGLTDAIYKYCDMQPCYEVLDVGCGAGSYVAALRRLGLFATGIDANPFTAELSGLLLPEGGEVCYSADITKDIEFKDQFGMVICINVLQYISDVALYKKAVSNIIWLAGNTLVLSFGNIRDIRATVLNRELKAGGFEENRFASAFFNISANRINDIKVYERRIQTCLTN